MKDKYFFDTNVLVYMQDASDPVKQQKARSLLSTHLSNGSAVISTQCLQEFFLLQVFQNALFYIQKI